MKPLMTAENFFGLPDLPFNLHLGLEFTRPEPDGPALLRLPRTDTQADANHLTHRAALYTVGEVAAAVAVLDELVEALPVFLLTLGATFREVATTTGAVHTRAVVNGAPDNAADALRTKRKLPFTADVSLLDDDERLVAQMTVSFNARPLSKTLESAFVVETSAG